MSFQWWFYSFSPECFDECFGGNLPGSAKLVTDAVTWEEGVWKDEAMARRLAAAIVRGGINYAGLSEAEASVLDQMMPLLFAREGLAEQLEVCPESPDGLHPSVVQELLAATRGGAALRLLPVLVGGRRLGQSEPTPACHYCILSAAEVPQLLAEVRQVLAVGGPWSREYVPQVAEEYLAGVLESAAAKGRPLVGLLG